ncbi:MAG: prolipoprotein diacylglyceryl transferase [bacterium]|nr:prolipoprotein diacylglyceryl transferase [bacterium]
MHPHLDLGPLSVSAYGLCLGIGFVTGALAVRPFAARRGIPPRRFEDVALVTAAVAVIGSRLLYVAQHPTAFAGDWTAILRPWSSGGLVMYGGAIPAVLAAFLAFRRWGIDPWRGLDAGAPGIALGMACTRLGCFLAGCCLGTPSDVPWAVTMPGDGVARHPAQLYAAVAGLAIFAALHALDRTPRRPGALFRAFLLLWLPVGFALDGVRAYDAAAYPIAVVPLTLSQWIALALFAWAALVTRADAARRAASPAGARPRTALR